MDYKGGPVVPMPIWRIEQHGANEWAIHRNGRVHYAQTAKDAVALMRALEKSE